MKKHYFRSAVAALLPLLLIAQPVEACTGFIIGKKLTADGLDLGRAYRRFRAQP